jgi:hypothetical protein
LDIIRVRPVRSAFKDKLAIVIDDHGEAVTIEAVVFKANEAVVFEANEAVVFKANEAVVFEANEAVVLEANEAVVSEANKAVVFEVRTHCRLVQRCGGETEGSSRTGFRR